LARVDLGRLRFPVESRQRAVFIAAQGHIGMVGAARGADAVT